MYQSSLWDEYTVMESPKPRAFRIVTSVKNEELDMRFVGVLMKYNLPPLRRQL